MDIRELFIGAIVRAKIVKWDYDDPELSEPMQVMAIDATEPCNLSVDLGFGEIVSRVKRRGKKAREISQREGISP